MTVNWTDTLRTGLSSDPDADRPAGVEIRQDLAPAGDLPVQPPSYEGRLEIHPRHIDGEQRDIVELDSVGSSANRIEEVLLDQHRASSYRLPVSSTTIETPDAPPITITTLEAPHRIFDAWIRLSDSSEDDGRTFEDSALGSELSMAHAGALDAILETSAHDLLFGVWDSHRKGPHGQVRIARSLTTTVIGLDPIEQAQFAARRDPLNLGEASDLPKGAKKLSEQGLSSIPPQKRAPFDPDHPADDEGGNGGVAITGARHLGFLSFAALRRLGFERYDPVDARMLLASLGLYALSLRSAAGWDLRSRCALVPASEQQLTVVDSRGGRTEAPLTLAEARNLFNESTDRVDVNDRSVQLAAGSKLNDLVAKAVAAGDAE